MTVPTPHGGKGEIRAPYPGLRPFLEHEEILIYGREIQVQDLVENLRQACFVAVIGGSGSGKSSLVRAGVVPHLRQYGIPEIGDVWYPVVVTPGTNAASNETPAESTPITRLAWKLEHTLLAGPPSSERRHAIAQLLRKASGLRRFIDTYQHEFRQADGVSQEVADSLRERARLLVVIDQFEELFDPSNREVPDARLLINRVIEHFHSAARDPQRMLNQRCFIAITMRSEHLNDCPAYPGLPEAINKSSYLVNRIEGEDLRKAISQPLERFLRLRYRQGTLLPEGQAPALPDHIELIEAVVDRLVRDTEALAHNPDHLPLLQHTLAQMWEAACRREAVADGGVPAQITFDDLTIAAVTDRPGPNGQAPVLQPSDNVLTLSLQRWAEALYQQRFAEDGPRRLAFDSLLKELAYKDVRAGTYNQQRVNVTPERREALWDLTHPGFVGHRGYLFWDDEDSSRITLKVQHESLIRGWERLRQVADRATQDFERWVQLLKDTKEWLDLSSPSELLGERALDRLREEGILDGHQALAQRQRWTAMLQHLEQHRDLDAVIHEVVGFVEASRLAVQDQVLAASRSKRQRRQRNVLYGVICVTGLIGAYAMCIKMPEVRRVEAYFKAETAARNAKVFQVYKHAGDADKHLTKLLDAAQASHTAQTGAGVTFGSMPDWPVLRWIASDSLAQALHRSDANLDRPTRATLTGSVWRLASGPATVALSAEALKCDGLPGRLVRASQRGDPQTRVRALFLTDPTPDSNKVESRFLYSARIEGARQCTLGNFVYSLPRRLDATMVLTADLSHIILKTDIDEFNQSGEASIQVMPVSWVESPIGLMANIQPALAVLVGETDAQVALDKLQVLDVTPTWTVPGGLAFSVGPSIWRVIEPRATPLTEVSPGTSKARLTEAAPHGACAANAANLRHLDGDAQPAAQSTLGYEWDGHCFAISSVPPPSFDNVRPPSQGSGAPGTAASGADDSGTQGQPARRSARRSVTVRLLAVDRHRPVRVDDDVQVLTSIPFGDVSAPVHEWYIGTAGDHDGWLMAQDPAAGRWIGTPLTLAALKRLGDKLLSEQKPR